MNTDSAAVNNQKPINPNQHRYIANFRPKHISIGIISKQKTSVNSYNLNNNTNYKAGCYEKKERAVLISLRPDE